MSDIGTCRTCAAELVLTLDELGQTGIDADLLRQVERLADGVILDLGSGRFAARPMHRFACEDAAHLAFDEGRVVLRAATMWDGLDVTAVDGDDERHELLARLMSVLLAADR